MKPEHSPLLHRLSSLGGGSLVDLWVALGTLAVWGAAGLFGIVWQVAWWGVV